jgi:hypothetical protein
MLFLLVSNIFSYHALILTTYIEVGTNADFQTSGTNQIVNPATAGDYKVYLDTS